MRHLLSWCALMLVLGAVLVRAQCDTNGQVTRLSYPSRWLGQTMYYSVYTPPCYDAQTAYPVLYLMHGSNENDGHWLRLGLTDALDNNIRAGVLPPLVVVLPFGNVIANRNRFDTVSWHNVFVSELMPHVEARYSVAQDAAGRAIGGISRGGFWAYQIGLQHPDLFATIGGHSPFFDRYHAPPEHNPLDLALSAPDIAKQRLWLDRGADDYARAGIDLMHARLNERGIPHTYALHPVGEHNNAYWSQHLLDYLVFYAEGLRARPAPTFGAFATNTPAAPTPTPAAQGKTLFVPAAAFPSLQTSVTSGELEALFDGRASRRLVLDQDTAAALRRAGVPIQPARVVAPDQLVRALWQERTAFTLLPLGALSPRLRALWVDDEPVFGQLDHYPFWLASDLPAYAPDRLTRLTVSGVTALARGTLSALDRFGIEHAASGIASYVAQSDFFHVSNEVSFAPTCPQLTPEVLGGATSFCSKRDHFELFRRLGVRVVELSGNHNNDYGYTAYAETFAWYLTNGMHTVGGGRDLSEARQPLRLTHNGNRIGWVSCNVVGPYYALANDDPASAGGVRGGAAPCDWDALAEAFAALKGDTDVRLATFQQREVEDYRPLPEQPAQFRRFAELGAHYVGGTAAHKPQSYAFHGDSVLHYGLGNLFFDQPFWGNVRFFMDTLLIYEGQLLGIELFAGIIEDNVRPRLMTAEERENFLFFIFNQHSDF